MPIRRTPQGQRMVTPPTLPIPAHPFDLDPEIKGRKGQARRCRCGLPEQNRIHQVVSIDPVETR